MAHIKTQTEWENDMSVKILQHARSEIYLDLRYLDVALSALKPQAMEGLETMATDGESLFFSAGQVIRVFRNNPAFMNRAYLHTILHCIFSHLFLKGNRDTKLWNLACDMAAENIVSELNLKSVAAARQAAQKEELAIMKSKVGQLTAEKIYHQLRSEKLPPHAPGQIISYVSAHDNFTLWDKLLMVRYARPEFAAVDKTALAQNRLAAGIYLTSMGLPFWQAGEEFARTKKGQGNSYRSSPALNRLDWHRAEQFHSLVDYYRGLIGLRAAFPRLGALDKASPAAIEFFPLEQPLVGWRLPAQWGDGAAWSALCVYYNPTETAQVVTLPGGSWKLLSDGISSSLWRGSSRICTGQTVLLPLSATVFGQV